MIETEIPSVYGKVIRGFLYENETVLNFVMAYLSAFFSNENNSVVLVMIITQRFSNEKNQRV